MASRFPALIDRASQEAAGIDRVELLRLAERAAVAAAGLIKDSEVELEPSLKDDGGGLVTNLDYAVEECIREELIADRPSDGFRGEELSSVMGESEVEWIVDPIDGTNNLIAGLPHWSISIAAAVHGRVEVGVVNAPALGQMYGAYTGGAVKTDGCHPSMLPRSAPELCDAVVATGFAPSRTARAEQMNQLDRVVGEVRDVRCHGAASLELCGVAFGRLDAYYEAHLQLWDVAAAALIATEAGIDVSGQPWSGAGTLIAAPAALVDPLRCLVDLSDANG